MLVRKEAKACGIVLYGIVLGLVLALPGCNANWPPIGSKEEAKLLARIPHSTEAGGGTTPANDLCNLASKLVLATAPSPICRR
jgi:hypothetical protein